MWALISFPSAPSPIDLSGEYTVTIKLADESSGYWDGDSYYLTADPVLLGIESPARKLVVEDDRRSNKANGKQSQRVKRSSANAPCRRTLHRGLRGMTPCSTALSTAMVAS